MLLPILNWRALQSFKANFTERLGHCCGRRGNIWNWNYSLHERIFRCYVTPCDQLPTHYLVCKAHADFLSVCIQKLWVTFHDGMFIPPLIGYRKREKSQGKMAAAKKCSFLTISPICFNFRGAVEHKTNWRILVHANRNHLIKQQVRSIHKNRPPQLDCEIKGLSTFAPSHANKLTGFNWKLFKWMDSLLTYQALRLVQFYGTIGSGQNCWGSLIHHKYAWSLPFPPVSESCQRGLQEWLVAIISVSLVTGELPTSLKESVIRPLLKKWTLDLKDLGSYRLVSNLPLGGKVWRDNANMFWMTQFV